MLLALLVVLGASPYADARRDYNDLDYEACVSALSDLRAVPSKDRPAAELLLGLCHFALGHEALARARLESALRKAPKLTAPANASPKETAVVEAAREAAALAVKAKKSTRGSQPKKSTAEVAESSPPPPPPDEVVKAAPVESHADVAPARAEEPSTEPSPAPPASRPADSPLASSLAPAPVSELPPAVVEPAPRRPSWVPWAVGGAALVAAGVGVGFGLSARGLESQANAAPVQVDAAQLRGQAEGSATAANVALAVAGTAALGAVVTWLVLR